MHGKPREIIAGLRGDDVANNLRPLTNYLVAEQRNCLCGLHRKYLEAKAHIPEAATPASKASSASLQLIEQSLGEARQFYAPRATATWSDLFYQYANPLAHQYFLRKLNDVPSTLVFLYFVNADDMLGPMSAEEWNGAMRLIHAVLGLPKDLKRYGVFDAFLDGRLLQDSVDLA